MFRSVDNKAVFRSTARFLTLFVVTACAGDIVSPKSAQLVDAKLGNGVSNRADDAWSCSMMANVSPFQTTSVHALSSHSVWAAGGYNSLQHYDGSSWTQANL